MFLTELLVCLDWIHYSPKYMWFSDLFGVLVPENGRAVPAGNSRRRRILLQIQPDQRSSRTGTQEMLGSNLMATIDVLGGHSVADRSDNG